MSQRKLLVNNTISNTLYYGIQATVVFITFPVVVKYFGRDLYGIYAFILSILSITQILNTSLNMTLTKYVSELHALHDFINIQHLIKSSYFISLLANCFVAFVLFACSYASPKFMHVQEDMWPQFVKIVKILAVFSVLNGFAQVPKGILLGLQRYSLANITTVPVLLGPVVAIILMRLLPITLAQYVAITQVAILVSGVWAYIAVKRVLPDIHHGLTINGAMLRRIMSFNFYQVMNLISDVLSYTTDKIILQNVAGSATVASYAVAERPNQLAISFTSLPLSAIVPVCSKAYAEQNLPLINKLVITGTRFYLLLVLPTLCTLTFLMHRFLLIWMGKEFEDLTLYAQLFMMTMIVAAPFKVFSHILVGKGRIREMVNVKMAYALINVFVSYLLARYWGILGVIFPTVFFWLVVYPITCLLLMKSEGISVSHFLLKTWIPSITIICVSWIVIAKLDVYFNYSLMSLLIMVLISIFILYSAVYIIMNISCEEKKLLKEMIVGGLKKLII